MPTTEPSPQASGNSGSAAVQFQPPVAAVGQGQDVVTLVPLDALIENESRTTNSSSAFVPFETEELPSPPVASAEETAVPARIPRAQD
jgi:hypothetical protein